MSDNRSRGRGSSENGQRARIGSDSREKSGSQSAQSSRRLSVTSSVIGSQRAQTRIEHRQSHMRGRHVSLRTKFMVLMAGMSGLGLIVLGGVMAQVANSYLFGQTVHKSIEIVKMAVQVVGAVREHYESRPDEFEKIDLENRLKFYLHNARRWGESDEYSDILDIQFDGGGTDLSGFTPMGDSMASTGVRDEPYGSVFIPRLGDVQLPEDIAVYRLHKPVQDRGEIPVYRFRVRLTNIYDKPGYTRGDLLVDVAGDTVAAVTFRLYVMIAIITALVIAGVLVVAHLMAVRITRPLRLLVRDMKTVAKGDLSHITKPHSNDEVGLLAIEFNRMTGDLKEAQGILIEQEKAAYELSVASEVQQQLLPAQAPEIEGYGLGAFYKGAKAVSGDYYDFIPLGNGQWGFIIADVSGKGIPGSMVMAVTRTIIRLVANKHRANAADTLKDTNRLIAKQIKRGMFVTAFYAVLDEATGKVTFASAGHNPMVIYRANGDQFELAAPKGIAIGFNDGPLFDKNIQQFQTQLAVGDAMVLYTDGFPEAMNEADEEFGDDEFYESVRVHGGNGAQGIVDGVVGDIADHRGDAAQSDDLTMVVVHRRS